MYSAQELGINRDEMAAEQAIINDLTQQLSQLIDLTVAARLIDSDQQRQLSQLPPAAKAAVMQVANTLNTTYHNVAPQITNPTQSSQAPSNAAEFSQETARDFSTMVAQAFALILLPHTNPEPGTDRVISTAKLDAANLPEISLQEEAFGISPQVTAGILASLISELKVQLSTGQNLELAPGWNLTLNEQQQFVVEAAQ